MHFVFSPSKRSSTIVSGKRNTQRFKYIVADVSTAVNIYNGGSIRIVRILRFAVNSMKCSMVQIFVRTAARNLRRNFCTFIITHAYFCVCRTLYIELLRVSVHSFMASFFAVVNRDYTCPYKPPYQREDGDRLNHFAVAVIRRGKSS